MGRKDGPCLSPEGQAQSDRLAGYFAESRIDGLHSSPRIRARLTAEPISRRAGICMTVDREIDEIDYGEWAGHSFANLQRDARWAAWNTARDMTRPPGGESMRELQARVLSYLRTLQRQYSDGHVVLVTHAEAIRVALLHALRRSFNEYASINIAPASISVVAGGRRGALSVLGINQTI